MNRRLCIVLLALVAGAAAALERRPVETRAGPYRVVVDRVSHNRTTSVQYDPATGEAQAPEVRRQVQVQIGVYTTDPLAASALATFQLSSMLCRVGRRTEEISHYGGQLESPNDKAQLRAYVYAPIFPAEPGEIAALEGEISAYDRATLVSLEVPLTRPLPASAEADGVKVTVREMVRDGDHARVVLETETGAKNTLAAPSPDGSHGVELISREGLPATSVGGSLVQNRQNRLEYRLGFLRLRGDPGRLRVRVVRQSGERKVYPFRLEKIPLPTRTELGEQP